MTSYPSKTDLELWIPFAVDVFQTIIPPIDKPYPKVHIATTKTYHKLRSSLVAQTGSKHTETPEDSVMEYIHGDNGYAILIRQNLIPDKNSEHFCWFFWHELGHFYAINSEQTDIHHYSDPGIVDDSRIIEFTRFGPVLGMSDERLKQEGYWFWQEFIAETISKYVSFKHRSTERYYHPELIDWLPQNWTGIVDKLLRFLDDTLSFYEHTIDEYSLAHYFANLLMDDFIVLFVKAANERKLKVYEIIPGSSPNEPENTIIVPQDKPIDPTCISDIDVTEFHEPLWKMKELLEQQMKKERFWVIDEEFLLDIGTCIGELMFTKIVHRNNNPDKW